MHCRSGISGGNRRTDHSGARPLSDPTQRAATSDGRSPRTILTSTFGDELVVNTAGQAKVFGVSIKDRGAVAMAGHAGKAFWFSKAAGEFVTSSYYYDAYPDWVDAWNSKGFATKL
mgnify:CR=1 FL=1